MRLIWMSILCGAVHFACGALDANELTKEEIAARDASYNGIFVGSTLGDFVRRFPQHSAGESDASTDTAGYRAQTPDGMLLVVQCSENYVYTLAVVCDHTVLSRNGGRDGFRKRLSQRFGTPTQETAETWEWYFPNVDRYVGFTCTAEGGANLVFIDTAANTEVLARKRTRAHSSLGVRRNVPRSQSSDDRTPWLRELDASDYQTRVTQWADQFSRSEGWVRTYTSPSDSAEAGNLKLVRQRLLEE